MSSLSQSISLPLTAEQAAAEHLAQITRDSFTSLLTNWKAGIFIVWSGDSQKILDAVQAKFVADPANNDSAAAMFQRASQTEEFLESQLSGCTTETLKLVKPFTANPDGSITITPESAPV